MYVPESLFKAYCFELLLRYEIMVPLDLERNFRPVYGVGVNPAPLAILAATDL